MFLLKAIQEHYAETDDEENGSVAFVIFNVKGHDLMSIHQPNDFVGEPAGEKQRVHEEYGIQENERRAIEENLYD